MNWLGTAHIGVAVVAILLGVLVFARPKGTRQHRLYGRLYLAGMIFVNLFALSIHDDSKGALGPFHYLAILSLLTIAAGAFTAFKARSAKSWALPHAYFMAWSFAGLLAAALGQLAVTLSVNVMGTMVTALVLFGLVIHTRVPPVVRALSR